MTAATQELQLAPATLFQKLWSYVWSGAVGFGAGGFVYGLYFLIFDASYKFFGHTYTLANVWNNLPQSAGLPQTYSFIHLGGEGGLGTWFVAQWPVFQAVILQGWPISVLGGAMVALAMNKGATKKITWFDELTLKMHNVFGVIPSRLQPEPTTGPQYVFVLPLALLFGGFGALVFFGADFGSVALLHHFGIGGSGIGKLLIDKVLNAVWFQILGGGFMSHQFWANKITMKPAADFMRFFEDRALGKALHAMQAISVYAADAARGTGSLLVTTEVATGAGRRVAVPWWYLPVYVRRLGARLALLESDLLAGRAPEFEERDNAGKVLMFIGVAVSILIMVVGFYNKFWVANHGGAFL